MAETVQSLRTKALAAMRARDNYQASGQVIKAQAENEKYLNLKAQADALEKKQKETTTKKTQQSDLDKAKADLAAAKAKAAQGIPGASALVKEKQALVDKLSGKSTPPPKSNVVIPPKSPNAFGPGIPITTKKDDKPVVKYTGSGTKDSPLLADGKPFSGTYNGKKYTNGIVEAATPTADNAVKTAWIGYLKTTFAALDDKTQKAEIDNLLTQAKAGAWTESEFMDHLKGTKWWTDTATSPAFKQFFLDSHDPRNASAFAASVSNTEANIVTNLEKLGIQVLAKDPVTGTLVDNRDKIKGLALEAIKNGWTTDSAAFQNYLATKADVIFTGGGLLGSSMDKIKSVANLYGVSLDKTQMDAINRGLLDPTDGRDAQWYLNDIKNQSFMNPLYKPFADIMQKNNTDLYSVTSAYRKQMANLLEVDTSQISWDDLMGKVVDSTTGNARTYSDFTKQVKSDPLWQKTKNAKETYVGMANDLMQMFGITG